MENSYDVIVIGGGIVGLSTAYKLLLRKRELNVLVLEKEDEVAKHQTGRNSGVIHSGIYYKPGSYKAKNCVNGRRELVAFAQEQGVAHDVCGKIIVATEKEELPHMEKVFQNGLANGVEGIEKINSRQITEIEPYCKGIAGIWVPCTGIVDFRGVCFKLVELINGLSGADKVLTGCKVSSFEHGEEATQVHTSKGTFSGKHIINCAGLQSDRLALKEGAKTGTSIVGFRGDYFDLTDQARQKVKNLIYPVPNPKFPFLGVHFTRMIYGGVECGPNAVFVFKREGYSKTSFSMKDTAEALTFSGTWKFFFKHWRFGLDEYKRGFSKQLFLKKLQRLIPSLELYDLKPGRCGVRAMALSPEGEMIDDFSIVHHGNAIHVLNAPSPAATAGLAIGSEIEEMARKRFFIS